MVKQQVVVRLSDIVSFREVLLEKGIRLAFTCIYCHGQSPCNRSCYQPLKHRQQSVRYRPMNVGWIVDGWILTSFPLAGPSNPLPSQLRAPH